RSYYEEVLIVRVHEDILKQQKLPPQLVGKRIWDERLADISQFEDYLARQGVIILKFFLHLSREEQKKRFLKRLDTPEKNWKFSASDVHERKFWDDYMRAYEAAIRATASEHAPWFIVPADNRWFTRLVVAAAIVEAVERLDLTYPKVDAEKKRELATIRAAVARETSRRARESKSLTVDAPWRAHVNDDRGSRWRGLVPARHERHDRWAQGVGRVGVAHGAEQGGSHSSLGRLLGC